jgi:hypothetical protein
MPRGTCWNEAALHLAVPPAQAGAHPPRPVTIPSPLAPARLWRCPHVGMLPVGWQRYPGTIVLVAIPRFSYLAVYQEIPARRPVLRGLAQELLCSLRHLRRDDQAGRENSRPHRGVSIERRVRQGIPYRERVLRAQQNGSEYLYEVLALVAQAERRRGATNALRTDGKCRYGYRTDYRH